MKPVIPRAAARIDVDMALDHYRLEAGDDVALRFVDALQHTYRLIAARPGLGSPRFAHELDLPELRYRKVGRFPYLLFYIERADHIDLWRMLHARRDIASWMTIDR